MADRAFAGYLSLHGRTVKIFDVVQNTVDKLTKLGGVVLEGHSDVTGFGKIELASYRYLERLWRVRNYSGCTALYLP